MKTPMACVVVGFLSLVPSLVQLTVAQSQVRAASGMLRLIRFSGSVKDASGSPLTGVVGITFALYSEQTGGAALWLETQNITADSNGHYTALLGSTKPDGLPAELFTSEQARWLAVRVAGQAEQPRVLLVAVPYAMKAADAETVGGLPPSAFVLAAPLTHNGGNLNPAATAASASGAPPATSNVTTTGGAVNAIPLFTTATNIQNSAIAQTGSGATARIGVGTTTPAVTLDVKGAETVRGAFTLPAIGAATTTAGANSQPQNLVASSFSSTTSTALNQMFRWQAEPAANNTASPSGTLNLLYGLGATTPSETGIKIASNGRITFAAGQTFPAAGTVKSVGLTAPASEFTVSGSPVTGAGTLGLSWKVAPTSANTANAIVKRDGTGSFNVTGISGSGTFSTTTANTNGVLVNASSATAVAIQANATAGSGSTIGVIGATVSPTSNSTGSGVKPTTVWGLGSPKEW